MACEGESHADGETRYKKEGRDSSVEVCANGRNVARDSRGAVQLGVAPTGGKLNCIVANAPPRVPMYLLVDMYEVSAVPPRLFAGYHSRNICTQGAAIDTVRYGDCWTVGKTGEEEGEAVEAAAEEEVEDCAREVHVDSRSVQAAPGLEPADADAWMT